ASASSCASRRSRCATTCAARASCSASTRSTSPTRASCSRSCPRPTSSRCSPPCARTRSAAARRRSAAWWPSTPAWSRCARSSAANAWCKCSRASSSPEFVRRPLMGVKEIDILWITAGLSCDGDSVSITAATQPSLEDILFNALPGLPKVRLHNPVLAYENGADFLESFHLAAEGKLDPFVLVIEGSIPNEKIKPEGYWAAMGVDASGQPITTCEWIDRLAPHALAVVAIGTCATYGGIPAMSGNPTGAMGLPDYLGWKWKSKAGIPVVCVPGCPVQPDNFMETVLYLLYQAAGLAPMIPLDEALRPQWLFGQ